MSITGKIKGAIFDMDGTLINSLILWDVIWESLGAKYLCDKSFRPSNEDDRAVRTMLLKDAMEYIHGIYNLGTSGNELLETVNEIIEKFYAEDVQLKEGTEDFLEYCRRNQIKMCVASATEKRLIEIAAGHCNIKKYFTKIFSCEEIGKGKDEPDIFLAALDYLGTPKEETYVIDDSLKAIETAVKAGFPTVGVYDRFNYGQEEMRAVSNEYIAEGETLCKLIY